MFIEPTSSKPRVSAADLVAPKRKPAIPPAITSVPSAALKRISAADLTVPSRKLVSKPVPEPRTAPLSNAERSALFDRLRALRDSLANSGSRHDEAIVLIEACIQGGIRTQNGIVGTLVHLGFNAKHAAMVLKNNTGSSPVAYRWRKGEDGRYSLLG